MFTGIIREVGRVASRRRNRLEVKSSLARPRAGESVAVNGACLTVVAPVKSGRLAFDVSPETWRLTNLGELVSGSPVNLEPALKAGEPLGGHLVSGHVDARARILLLEPLPGGFVLLRAALPAALRGLVALKGSIAVDGVSLTVTAVKREAFESVLVPHTLEATNLATRRKGEVVNLEADLLARYVRSSLREARRLR